MSMELFRGAIPGQSLTNQLGSASYEHPPQYADVNDALEYLFDKLTEKRQVTRLVILLKQGVPVEYIARSILFEGFSKGMWTPDSAMLMLRIVMAMIISIAAQKGVKAKYFNPDKEQDQFLDQFVDLDMPEDEVLEEEVGNGEMPKFTGLLGMEA